MRRTPVAILALVALVALSALAASGVGAAGQAANQSTATATATATDAPVTPRPDDPGETATETGQERAQSGSFTIQELTGGPTGVPEIHDSWRPMSSVTGAAWVKHYPANPWVDPSPGSSDWTYLESGETVKRNFVDLTVMRLGDRLEYKEATLHVVYWQERTRTVRDGNVTRTERYAANQTHTTKTLGITGIKTKKRVSLKPHYDGPVRVTMWIEGFPDARWSFVHHSSKTQQAATVDSRGGQVLWGIKHIVGLGIVSILVGSGLGEGANRRAVRGPRKGWPWWLLGVIGTGFVTLIFAWSQVSSLLVVAPGVLGIALGLIGFIQRVESSRGTETVELFQPVISPAKTASGNDGVEMHGFRSKLIPIARDDDDRMVVVPPGIRSWIKRLAGAVTYVRGVDDVAVGVESVGGPIDELYYVDPLTESIADVDRTSWTVSVPDWSTAQVAVVAALSVVSVVIASVVATTWAGLVVPALLVVGAAVSVSDGEIHVEPAPAHFGDAHANMMVLAGEYAAVRTVDDANEELYKERARRKVLADQAQESKDLTLVEESLGYDGDDDIQDVDLDRESLARILEDSDSPNVLDGDADRDDVVDRVANGGSADD